jgi:hypothetical protein
MGFSWAITGEVTVGTSKLGAFRRAPLDPARYAWPDSWGTPNGGDAETVEAVIAELESEAEACQVTWRKDGVSWRAIFSNSSGLWLDRRSHLAALGLVVADLGGTAEVAITGFIDGGPDDVYLARSARGQSGIEVLTAREARRVSERVIAQTEPLIEAMLEAALPTVSVAIPQALAPIHARVCQALQRHVSDPRFMKEARAYRAYAECGKKFDTLDKLFPKPPALLDALEGGWKGISAYSGQRLVAFSFRLLAALDPEAASTIAPALLALRGGSEEDQTFFAGVIAEARAATTPSGTEKECRAALRRLRAQLPRSPHYTMHNELQELPAVRVLRERMAPTLARSTRQVLREVAGTPPKLKKLAGPQQVYAYALSLILERGANDDDRRYLARLWTDSGGFVLLDHARVLRLGPIGQQHMASLYGREFPSQYDIPE